MKMRPFLFILMIIVVLFPGCVKDTYNMKMLSKKAHLSPTFAISAVKGDISFSDMVKPNDTLIFDQNKLVTIVFKKDSIVDLLPTDFSKGTIVRTAQIDPGSFDLNIKKFLSHISGDFLFSNPSLRFIYKNSFPDSVRINLIASGKRKDKEINLTLKPFGLIKPNIPVQSEVSATHLIDRNNSNLPALLSLPPEIINYSGSVTLTAYVKSNQVYTNNYAVIPTHMTGSLELEVPMELKINNLQFTDTVNNFLNDSKNSDSKIKAKDFQLLSVIVAAKNGFPLGASVRMSLYNSTTHTVLNTVDAAGILEPAPVDGNGKTTGVTESSAVIDFSRDFLSSVDKADKIIFRFTLNSTGNGSQNVRIYSDYRIKFTAALVVKPDINLN
jgi:hypothetical protein